MKTQLVMLTEHSPFMMSFVYLTAAGNAVVIDGGRPEDMPWLFEVIGDRRIAAWILTHPHLDHISGFIDVIKSRAHDAQIGHVYYKFPSAEFALRCEPDEPPTCAEFEQIEPLIREKAVSAEPGLQLRVDELTIDFLYCGGERHEKPRPNLAINESSIAFRVTASGLRSALFLGDLGPEGGRELLSMYGERLQSDIVQMSHHGHSGVTKEVYARIAPKACLWCAPDWLWDEDDVEFEPELWGTKHQRRWMDEFGVTEHYISKNGTQSILLEEGKLYPGRQ